MAAAPVLQAATGALIVGGVAIAAGRRAAHAEDPDFDLGDSTASGESCSSARIGFVMYRVERCSKS